MIGLISAIVLFFFGVFRLITGDANEVFSPILFIIGGFFGIIGGMIEIKKQSSH